MIHDDDPVPAAASFQEAVERMRNRVSPPGEELPRGAGLDFDLDDIPTLDTIKERQWQAAIPGRFLWARIDDLDPALVEPIKEWAAAPQGRNLLFLGPVGTGKTHAAVAAARLLNERGMEVRFLPSAEMLDLLRPDGGGDLYDLAATEILVLDDLALERVTDWTAERMYLLLNRRWLEQLPTIVTTNFDPPHLQEILGERMYSRLVGSGTIALRIGGEDRRRGQARG